LYTFLLNLAPKDIGGHFEKMFGLLLHNQNKYLSSQPEIVHFARPDGGIGRRAGLKHQ
jgi:hypothetical protein